MNKFKSLTFLVAILGLAFGGLATDSLAATGDAIAIKNIQVAPAKAADSLVITVTVDWTLGSKPEGTVMLGLDLKKPDSYEMLAEQTVAKGRGTVELRAEISGSADRPLTAYVNLSEHPHPRSWSPLASGRKPVVLPAEK
jgi:hypothetical protein